MHQETKEFCVTHSISILASLGWPGRNRQPPPGAWQTGRRPPRQPGLHAGVPGSAWREQDTASWAGAPLPSGKSPRCWTILGPESGLWSRVLAVCQPTNTPTASGHHVPWLRPLPLRPATQVKSPQCRPPSGRETVSAVCSPEGHQPTRTVLGHLPSPGPQPSPLCRAHT